MNKKIFNLIMQNLEVAFALPKYDQVRLQLCKDTRVDFLPWTPARKNKFETVIQQQLGFEEANFKGTVEEIVERLDQQYLARFFGEIWKPNTEKYHYSGWSLVDLINNQNPQNVLDVGCGYNPFKTRIANLTGIDPYNNCADYMVDILEYCVPSGSHDHIIALGAINFNDRRDVEKRFAHCVDLLQPGGKFYLRANPGIPHVNGPWVDIFKWSFGVAKELEIKYGLHLDEFKKDANDRLFFVYTKN